MNFSNAPEFGKELKKLAKKWRSLPDDVEAAKLYIAGLYVGENSQELADYRAAFFNGRRATILQTFGEVEVVKMRLDVASLGSNDKVRIIFIAVIKDQTVTFIELYAKNEKSREDPRRIKRYLQ